MKIEATCGTCKRTFLLSQIGPDSDEPGRCPFCGARFARHYTGVLVESVADTEIAAANFITALSRLQAMETGFRMDIRGMLESLKRQVQEHEMRSAS